MKITRFDELYGETIGTGVTIGSTGVGFETTSFGGGSIVNDYGNLGATATFDPAVGNILTGTLTANCTFTLTAPASGTGCTIELRLTQDGTGSRLVTWPGSVVWAGGTAPVLATTPGAIDFIVLETIDGGTTWYGFHPGGGSAGTVTSVALTVPAEFSVSGSPITGAGTLAVTKANESANTVWAGPTTGSAAAPTFRALVAADIPTGFSGEVLMVDGITSPPEPMTLEDGTDWLYQG